MSPLRWCKKLLLITLLLSLAMCKSAPKNSEQEVPLTPDEKDGPGETVLIKDGLSSQASFAPSGDKLIYVSRKRRAHAQAQVYEYYLLRKSERRITFQDGNTFQPVYHPADGLITYSSSTDELKEYSPLLNPANPKSKKPDPFSQPLEVYLHALEGLEIVRVTRRQGFDGEARFSHDGSMLTWTQATPAALTVVAYNRQTRALRQISPVGVNASGYSASPDGVYRAWFEWNKDLTVPQVHLQMGKVKSQINADGLNKTDLSFSPDSKWLLWAAREPGGENFDLWAYDLQKGCARRLTSTPLASEKDPALSHDMKSLVYTKITKARSRIMQAPFDPPTSACPAVP